WYLFEKHQHQGLKKVERRFLFGNILPSKPKNSPPKIFNKAKIKDDYGGKYPQLLLCPLFGS
ncbi:MAG: hypothetical protein QME78_18415, partial [Thermodesulfobacteriota bacterium]|nr:hypothetical protein [Thermodesulfobacteriota bacterium]